jgi:hypothetical protein
MKASFLLFLILSCFAYDSNAQTGIYKYADKSTKAEIELNLRRDGVFFYSYSKDWTNCITEGKWRPLGSGKVILTTAHQLSDYSLEELEDPKIKHLQVIIQGKEKGQSPTSISSIFINEDETALLEMDGESGLKMLEERQKLMMAASAEIRDSLKNTDLPRFYKYNKVKDIKSITIEFDQRELIIPIKNPKATQIIITTAFATNAAYHYMAGVEFIADGKFIREEGSTIKLKKQKR